MKNFTVAVYMKNFYYKIFLKYLIYCMVEMLFELLCITITLYLYLKNLFVKKGQFKWSLVFEKLIFEKLIDSNRAIKKNEEN